LNQSAYCRLLAGNPAQDRLQVSHVLYVASLLVILCHDVDIAAVIERAKQQHAFDYSADGQHSSLMLYGTMQPEYKSAEHLSVVKCVSNRRLGTRFSARCHGAGKQAAGQTVFI
jgi:hypothetical protein